MRGSHLNRLQRTAHVVSQYAEEEVAALLHLRMEVRDRLGESLVDGLVETDDV